MQFLPALEAQPRVNQIWPIKCERRYSTIPHAEQTVVDSAADYCEKSPDGRGGERSFLRGSSSKSCTLEGTPQSELCSKGDDAADSQARVLDQVERVLPQILGKATLLV